MKGCRWTRRSGSDTASGGSTGLTHCEGEGLAKQDAAAMDKALGGALRELVQSKEFEGKANETLVFHCQGKAPASVWLVGLGKKTM